MTAQLRPMYGAGEGVVFKAWTLAVAAALAIGLVLLVAPAEVHAACAVPSVVAGVETDTFCFTGGAQTWTVPAGVTSATFDVSGARGGGGVEVAGGNGGVAKATINVAPNSTIRIFVGGRGGNSKPNGGAVAGGFNGGGDGGTSGEGTQCCSTGAGGGGASDIRVGGAALANRLIVAGGGGGASDNANGGAGGGDNGADGGANADDGKGATPTAGGAGGTGHVEHPNGQDGSRGQGGNGANDPGEDLGGGGGGGGYFGGGGGAAYGGGGGGSGFGPAGATLHTGSAEGLDGLVTVSFALPAEPTPTPNPEATPTPTPQPTPVPVITLPPTNTLVAASDQPRDAGWGLIAPLGLLATATLLAAFVPRRRRR